MTVKVELLDDLDAVERDAAGALDRRAQLSLFDRLSWFRLLARHCPPAGKFLGVRATDGNSRAWLFLAREGRTARAYSAWYSLRFGAIGDAALVPRLADALKREGLARIDLAPLDRALPLKDAFNGAGWMAFLTPATVSWQVSTEDRDFAAYWAARPGKLRSTAARKAKSANLEIVIYDRFDEDAWSDYEAIYRASWKPHEGSPAFLRALAEQEGAAGTLRLGIARKDGEPVAAQFWLVEKGHATIHKLAYAEWAKPLSPGTVLGMAMFRHVIDRDRVKRIDYGTGDDGYKRDWMEERHILWRLTVFNPRTLSGLAGAARAAFSALVRRIRSG
ncbi:GNAT family N-acetyltransferase [Sphingosinicella rhizophila]|uniref:GNAT family N-acetyltransferase n=1 Tax=Sphingosinicella rhizophila TaxID=3050082 RepID=A0ABU3Q301_9SPHN|nr:GNAT family N-acetyltransferase [Sphingosinicella sp. GR2756]MDT9597764.1 GNAT family N-acetyltransferase [Sphingosinicella sp. GR2756]